MRAGNWKEESWITKERRIGIAEEIGRISKRTRKRNEKAKGSRRKEKTGRSNQIKEERRKRPIIWTNAWYGRRQWICEWLTACKYKATTITNKK